MTAASAVAERLMELAAVVSASDDGTYVMARADGVSGSMGAHVRHTIDHVSALVDAPTGGAVDYDSRRRGTNVETSRASGLAELHRLADRLQWLAEAALAAPVELSAVVDRSGQRVAARSTLGRELVFVMSHTIHHQAIIALLLASTGHSTPERFGLAPSTPSPVPCAR